MLKILIGALITTYGVLFLLMWYKHSVIDPVKKEQIIDMKKIMSTKNEAWIHFIIESIMSCTSLEKLKYMTSLISTYANVFEGCIDIKSHKANIELLIMAFNDRHSQLSSRELSKMTIEELLA